MFTLGGEAFNGPVVILQSCMSIWQDAQPLPFEVNPTGSAVPLTGAPLRRELVCAGYF